MAQHWSATVLGFPNSFVGMMTVASDDSGGGSAAGWGTLPRWFVRSAWGGAVLGMIFAPVDVFI